MLHLDPHSPLPLWAQIENGLRRRIASGSLRRGDPRPSVRDLARERVVNPATVAKAFRHLAEHGVVLVRRGEGTFVAPLPRSSSAEWIAVSLEAEALRLAAAAKTSGLGLEQAQNALDRAWQELDGDSAPQPAQEES